MLEDILLVSAGVLTELPSLESIEHSASRVHRQPPLGPLVAATLFRAAGVRVSFLHTDHVYRRHLTAGGSQGSFPEALAQEILGKAVQWVGFSTLCSSYPLTLWTIRLLKRRAPWLRVVLGGPQSSVTAQETLLAFPEIDAILTGEVELSVGLFVEAFDSAPESVPGLAWRSGSGIRVNTLPDAPSMDQVPRPAFDLWEERAIVDVGLEAGRGCPFHCRFCSTSGFFQHRFRVVPIPRLLDEICALVRDRGVISVALNHDHFGVDLRHLQSFCHAWRAREELGSVTWRCSLRPDIVDRELADLMKSSGCEAVFLGVETGSQRLQRVIGKNLRLDRSRAGIQAISGAGLDSTASFITGFPEETPEDQRETVEWFKDLLLVDGCHPQLLTLSPLGGSDYARAHAHELFLDQRFSPMAGHSRDVGPDLEALLSRHPELFSAHYALPSPHLRREETHRLVLFLTRVPERTPLPVVAAAHYAGGLSALVALWWIWFDEHRPPETLTDPVYLSSPAFRQDFSSFLRELTIERGWSDGARSLLEGLLVFQEAVLAALPVLAHRLEAGASPTEAVGENTRLVPLCVALRFPGSMPGLLERLRAGEPPEIASGEDSVILLGEGYLEHRRTSLASPFLALVLTTLGDGMTLRGLLDHLESHPLVQSFGAPPEAVLVYAVQTLLEDRRIGVELSASLG